MSELIRIDEGYYQDKNGKEYKSIWRFKNDEGFTKVNYTAINGQEALEIKNLCIGKSFEDFNLSNTYDEGYVYDIETLRNYYKDRPKKITMKRDGK